MTVFISESGKKYSGIRILPIETTKGNVLIHTWWRERQSGVECLLRHMDSVPTYKPCMGGKENSGTKYGHKPREMYPFITLEWGEEMYQCAPNTVHQMYPFINLGRERNVSGMKCLV